MASTPGWATRCSATATAPCTTLSTPGGKPGSWKQRAIRAAVATPLSEGLKSTVLPASNAGTSWPLGRWPGKLKGPSTAATPWGRCRISPGSPSTTRSRVKAAPSPRLTSTLVTIAATSAWASQRGLPISRPMASTRAAWWAWRRSW